jgi:RNA polymerase sigma factor (sigma-70 family)
MHTACPNPTPGTDFDLLSRAQCYLTHKRNRQPPNPDLEAAWKQFYDLYAPKIRAYAFTCGAAHQEIGDCVQEVWRELLLRLPAFRLDPQRGQFDTWLYQIVKSKTADIARSHKTRLWQAKSAGLQYVADNHLNPALILEDQEMVGLAWARLRQKLSWRTFLVLQLRLVEQRPVVEVAQALGLSHQQVWYRYHRARQELVRIGSALARGQRPARPAEARPHEEKEKEQDSAQGKAASTVSLGVRTSSPPHQGGSRVDYVFQRLELGRRELSQEWKVEWNCDGLPRPVVYNRRCALVAYAEMCGPGDFINTHWQRIVNAAITAGVAAGIATIIATPTAALPIFQTEFHKQFQGKGGGAVDGQIQIALSAKQEANGPWCVCKT